MSYKPNIPGINDFLSKSQRDMRRNYDQINRQFSVDHEFLLNDDQYQGDHKKISFVEQGSDPTTGADEVAIYSKDSGTNPDLYYAPESAGTIERITVGGKPQAGLLVEAGVIFDNQGNIVEDENGNSYSYNVTSVTPNNALVNGINVYDDWTINFDDAISTDNFFWNIGYQHNRNSPTPNNAIQVQVTNNAIYGSAVSTSSISLTGYSFSGAADNRTQQQVNRVTLIVYTRS